MTITEEQAKNGYPVKVLRFMHDMDKYLSDEVDEYGLKKCRPDSFDVFTEVDANAPKRLMKKYHKSVKAIHKYLDKGLQL